MSCYFWNPFVSLRPKNIEVHFEHQILKQRGKIEKWTLFSFEAENKVASQTFAVFFWRLFFINPGLLIPKTEPQTTNDHPLLRQVLEDFPFESKFGDDFGSSSAETEFRCQVKSELDDSLSEAVKMSPVISLAVEQVKKDIDTTCQILRIAPGKVCKIMFSFEAVLFEFPTIVLTHRSLYFKSWNWPLNCLNSARSMNAI